MRTIVILGLLMTGCTAAPSDASDEQSLASAATGNPLEATRYYVMHAQDYSVTNTADRVEGTHPYGGPIPGFFNPGVTVRRRSPCSEC